MNRRDFLKLLSASTLTEVSWPYISPSLTHWRQNEGHPNILVLVFDTLSAKHMSIFDYARETSPNLTRFAEKATVFNRHYAAGNFTTPGTASILTGVYPWSHRAINLHGIVSDDYLERNIFNLLPNQYYRTSYTHNLLVFSLLHQFRSGIDHLKRTRELCLRDNEYADRLFIEDYNVAFFSEWALLMGQKHPASLFLSMVDRAFRSATKTNATKDYTQLFPRGIPELHNLSFVLEDVVDWLKDEVTQWPQPFFAYIHLLPPHEPYSARRDFVDSFDDGWKPPKKPDDVFSEGHEQGFLNKQRREYDEYLAYTDSEFGRLYDGLQQSGILENTYFVVTSDHGELFERGIRGHVTETMYDPLLHVPLLIAKPGQEQREDVFTRTSCVDLLPTFLHLAGEPMPGWSEGQILPTFEGGATDDNRSIFAMEAKRNPSQAPLNIGTISLVQNQHKLVHYFGYKGSKKEFELFDLASDPEEMTDQYQSKPEIAAELQGLLKQRLEEINEPFIR
jgi:arylsulfatase A-like enzyme